MNSNIRTLRQKKGLTQSELGALVGKSQTVIANWETRGNLPRVPDLPKLAKALGVTIDELLSEDE